MGRAGWATEQLAQEMGFYKGNPLWELGYIHDALLRSARLVTDSGLHHLKWTREKAIAEMRAIEGDPEPLAAQEIERYSVWPGQACSYMVGKVTILKLREKAKAALGAKFDPRKFLKPAIEAMRRWDVSQYLPDDLLAQVRRALQPETTDA